MGKRYFQRFKSVIISIIALIIVSSIAGIDTAEARHFHTSAELARLHDLLQTAPYDTNTYFATGGRCGGCHGHDPNGISLVTPSGEDVNIMDDWAGTMMANSAKDPLWRAKVSHEILVNPGDQVNIEDKCTTCHAPTGHFEAHFLGQSHYGIASLATDSFGNDGVNCSACHAQKDSLMGHNYSGDLQYAEKHEWGPIQNPVSAVMEFFVGFQIDYSPHVTNSEFCAGCHTLITQTQDLAGNPTGGSYIEQATYLEWKNSVYQNQTTGRTCQNCHIPRINDSIKLATDYPWIEARSPFGKHHLVGGNAFMLQLMHDNMSAIGSTCNPSNYDTTIARTKRNLRDSTLFMNVVQTARTVDTAFFDVQLENKTGHKFPSGYPSRIAWVQFVVTDNNGDTIYQSGMMDSNGNLVGRDPGFEPHHNVCYTNNDVQIYEMVMGDVANNPTTVLERADTCLKDNRIVPKGFSTSHPSYDSTKIIGTGADPDFNYTGPTEGTGADVVHYHVFLNGYAGTLNITSTVYYSAVPRAWLQEMFALSSTEIDTFKTMYNNADQTPMVVAQTIMNNTITSSDQGNAHPEISVFPVPSADGHLTVTGWQKSNLVNVRVYDLLGKEVTTPIPAAEFTGTVNLPKRGVYLLVMETKEGKVVKRVMW
jgi:hypothetical protein